MVLIYWSWGWPCVSPEAWVFQFYLSWGKLEALVETSLKLKKLRVPLQTGEKSYFGKVDVKNDVHQNFETIKKKWVQTFACFLLDVTDSWNVNTRWQVFLVHVTNHYLFCREDHPLPAPHLANELSQKTHHAPDPQSFPSFLSWNTPDTPPDTTRNRASCFGKATNSHMIQISVLTRHF